MKMGKVNNGNIGDEIILERNIKSRIAGKMMTSKAKR
jgi:hypothetical protein